MNNFEDLFLKSEYEKLKVEDKLSIASIRRNIRISKKKIDSRKVLCSDKERISWRTYISDNSDQDKSKSNVYVLGI